MGARSHRVTPATVLGAVGGVTAHADRYLEDVEAAKQEGNLEDLIEALERTYEALTSDVERTR